MSREFLEELLRDIENCQADLSSVANKIKDHMQTEMYRIELRAKKIYIPCAHCLENGEINPRCNKCGGKGTHAKTKSYWGVAKKMVEVVKITNERPYGKVYWTSKSDFFQDSKNLLFDTKAKAEWACSLRNEMLDRDSKVRIFINEEN